VEIKNLKGLDKVLGKIEKGGQQRRLVTWRERSGML
jgi:hypothetical protein